MCWCAELQAKYCASADFCDFGSSIAFIYEVLSIICRHQVHTEYPDRSLDERSIALIPRYRGIKVVGRACKFLH
jgi:hypothetical protein